MLKTVLKKLFYLIPAQSQLLLRASQRYVDNYFGDNNSDPSQNGEELYLQSELRKYSGREGIIFDVGANIGEWSSYCLGVEPTLKMHLFEPSKITFNKLNIKKWPPNIHLNNFGLGERNEKLGLNIAGDGSGMNSLHIRQGVKGFKIKSTENVDICTLDGYCDEKSILHIHLLKVDVEGHELAVFKGAQKMLREKRISCIQFEYGGCNLDARIYLLDIWNYLSPLGYEFYKLYQQGPRKISKYDQSMENFKYSNWLAVLPN
jgi:FkbM family methyltransferase